MSRQVDKVNRGILNTSYVVDLMHTKTGVKLTLI